MRAYMKRFNEEMLKLEDLIELIALEALSSGVREKHLWKELYALLDRKLLKVKEAMENHIRVKETSTLRHDPPHFSRDKHPDRSPKWSHSPKKDRSPKRDNNPKKGQKKLMREHLSYFKVRKSTPMPSYLVINQTPIITNPVTSTLSLSISMLKISS
ncbi:hypothetical protein Peur_007696 [Populus x canadensis]